MPEVSVILPVYNAEPYLEAAIESILQQTFADMELLVWDDGSTDRSQEIAKRFAEQDSRVKLHGGVNVGVSTALNRMVAVSDSAWIFRMDADDISRNDRIELQLAYCKKNQLDICGSFITYTDKNKIRQYPINDGELKHGMYYWGKTFAHPTVVFNRRLFDILQYDEQHSAAQDIDLWLRSLSVDGIRMSNFPEPLLYYRRHSGQLTEQRRVQQDSIARQSLSAAIRRIYPALSEREFDLHVRANQRRGLLTHEFEEYMAFIAKLDAQIVHAHGDHHGLAKWYLTLAKKQRHLAKQLLKNRPHELGFLDVLRGLV